MTEDGLTAKAGLSVNKFYCGIGKSFTLHLLMMNFYIDEKKIISSIILFYFFLSDCLGSSSLFLLRLPLPSFFKQYPSKTNLLVAGLIFFFKLLLEELFSGRINLVELAQRLNVDLSHVAAKASEVERSTPGCTIIMGQLIDKQYIDTISKEINEKLLTKGQITISELTRQYDLPSDFLQNVSS